MKLKTIYWDARDVKTDDGPIFQVFAFGRLENGTRVTLHIHDVEPWIHVVIPSDFSENVIKVATDAIFKQLVKKLEKDDHSPTRYEITYRLPYYYYTNETQPCMKIHFKTEDAARHCHNLMRYPFYINRVPYTLLAVEDRIDQLTKFHAEYGLKHCVWLELKEDAERVEDDKKYGSNDVEFKVSQHDIRRLSPDEEIALPTLKASYVIFDYEMFSKRKYAFPDELNSSDVIFMCGLLHVFWSYELDKYIIDEYCLVFHRTIRKKDIRPIPCSILRRVAESKYEIEEDPTREVQVFWYDDEIDLIEGVEDLIINLNPDAVMGHNSNGFDFPYHKVRKGRLMVPFKNLSRLKDFTPGFEPIKWSSSAYKDIALEVPSGPGRIYFDTLLMAKRSVTKEDTYGLDAMCQKYMGIGKHPWDATHIFSSFSGSDPEELRKTMVYCLRDVWCTWGLFEHMGYWFSYEGLSDVIGISIFDLFARGQGARTRPQIFKECYNRGYYLFSPDREPKKIAGGYVFPQNAELVEWMLLLDFEGLYPSVMDYYNISNDTDDHNKCAPDNKVNVFEWEDDCGKWKTRFVKRELRDGIIPQVLRGLRAKRKEYKAKMEECKKRGDKIGAMIYFALQDATKVSMNSVYGGLAQAGGYLGDEDAGATVTALGRMLVQKMAEYVVSKGWRVVYGDTDSVMIHRIQPLTEDEKVNFDKLGADFVAQLNKDLFTGMAPINVALDGLFRSYLTIAKKMYCFVKWDKKNPLAVNEELWSSKGVASAKRDSCKMNRKLYKKLAIMITCMKDFDEVIMALLEEIGRLLYGELDVEDMITVKQLSAEYVKPNYPMAIYYRHLQEIGLGPKPGDRVPYVLRLKKGAKYSGDFYEDPDVFVREKQEFARMEYLKSQFAGRIDGLLYAAYPQFIPVPQTQDGPGFLGQIPNYYGANPKLFKLDTAIFNIIEKHVKSRQE